MADTCTGPVAATMRAPVAVSAIPGGVRPGGLTARLFHRQHEAYPAPLCTGASSTQKTTRDPCRPFQTRLMMQPPVSQTRSFTTVFLIEMWERFGYYGMAALIPLHGRPARFHRQPCEPDLGCVHRTRLCGAVDRRLDRRQGARRPSHDDHRRGRAVRRLPDAVGPERSADVHVRVARRDRRRQRPVQGQRGQPRAPHL